MSVLKQCIVFAGGRGERLLPLTYTTPKPLVAVAGRPFLDHLIGSLQVQGISRFVLLTGFLGDQIEAHYAGRDDVICCRTPEEWGTGRRLADAEPLLDERFLLCYGDNIAPVSVPWLVERHETSGASLTLTAVEKSCGNVRVGRNGVVEKYDPQRRGNCGHVEIGYMVVERDRIGLHSIDDNFQWRLWHLVNAGQVAAFAPAGLFYHSVGDLERLRVTDEYLRPKKVVLIDRDGVINRKAPRGEYVARKEDFVWLEDNVRGMEVLAAAGYEFVVVTNQAGIGRGVMSADAVKVLHWWMTDELAKRGVVVCDSVVCPHHWEDGCACRKPLPKMLYEAAQRFDFRLDRCFYVGDDERDRVAARRAACRFVNVGGKATLKELATTMLRCLERWEKQYPKVERSLA